MIETDSACNTAKPARGTIGAVFAAVNHNAGCSEAIAVATGQVIAKRVAMGMDAAIDPLRADHAEFQRMVPEKVEAFAAAGMILLKQSGEANRQMARFASDSVMTATNATIAMAGCATPAALLAAQSRFAFAWFDQAASNCLTMGVLALTAQGAAMTPIRQTVVGNAERLGQAVAPR